MSPVNANGTAAPGSGITDLDILQYALSLELFEITVYEAGVTKFSASDFASAGYSEDTYYRFEEIISQELGHIGEIRRSIYMLGGTPVQACNSYNLPPIPSVQAFLNVTDIVNGLGPSAYAGAGAYVTDKVVLTTGASIGQIEARHNSWLNGVIHRDEFPTLFQLALTPTQAYSVITPYLGDCSNNPKLNAVKAMPPALNITNKGAPGKPLNAYDTVYLQPASSYKAPSYGTVNAAFLYSFNTTIVSYDASSMTAQIPSDAAGQVYVALTTATQGQALSNENTLTGLVPFFIDVPASKYANTQYRFRQYS